MSRDARVRPVIVKVHRLKHAEGLALPAYQTADAAGFDLIAAVPEKRPLVLAPGERAMVPTGLIFELPGGTEAQVRPRSGLAAKAGVTVLNSPGTIDADYRGEVSVILINLGKEPFTIRRGERIAQMIVASVARAILKETKSLSATKRGAGGFGSTGLRMAASSAGGAKKKSVASASARKQTKSRSKRSPSR